MEKVRDAIAHQRWTDNLLNDSENSVVELQNHELNEQLMLINQLDEDEKNALFKIINPRWREFITRV